MSISSLLVFFEGVPALLAVSAWLLGAWFWVPWLVWLTWRGLALAATRGSIRGTD